MKEPNPPSYPLLQLNRIFFSDLASPLELNISEMTQFLGVHKDEVTPVCAVRTSL